MRANLSCLARVTSTSCLEKLSLNIETSPCFKLLMSSVETFHVASDADAKVSERKKKLH